MYSYRKICVWAGGCLLLLAFMMGNTSCDSGPAQTPAYIRIDTIYLDSTSYDSTGSVSHRIRYAWVYLDDNLQGVYQLPVVFPVLADGSADIRIYGGVQENGLSSTLSRYPFYDPFDMPGIFAAGDTLELAPHIRYNKGLKIGDAYMDDFEDGFLGKYEKVPGYGGSFQYVSDPANACEGTGYGSLFLQEGDIDLMIESDIMAIPKGKAGYFIEMNYKNNCGFVVSLQDGTSELAVGGLNPRDYWNKIYFNITDQVDGTPGTNLKILIRVPQDTTIPNQMVYLDNIKLVFR